MQGLLALQALPLPDPPHSPEAPATTPGQGFPTLMDVAQRPPEFQMEELPHSLAVLMVLGHQELQTGLCGWLRP